VRKVNWALLSSISRLISIHAGGGAELGVDSSAITQWRVHGLCTAGLDVEIVDTRRVKAALQMKLSKADQNDAKGWHRWHGQVGAAGSTSGDLENDLMKSSKSVNGSGPASAAGGAPRL
jgi:hypothetical protein